VNGTRPVTVVVPTIGRADLVESCLVSLAACEPRAAEVIVADQSGRDEVRQVAKRFEWLGVRLLSLDVRSKPLALNLALEEAANEVVLVTDDDCTVDPAWVGAGWAAMSVDPEAVVTGRVLPAGEPSAVPSTIDEAAPRDYTGTLHYGALYGGNMACNRTLVLAFGGFDPRFEAAEDNDFCYRWLRAGRSLRYEPDLVVWHHAWRSPEELVLNYRAYGHGQGVFYAKHLRRGDLRVAPFLLRDLYRGARGVAAQLVRGRSAWPDPRTGLLRGVVVGLVRGLRSRPR
jgi:GT2 family glycosyltransferase